MKAVSWKRTRSYSHNDEMDDCVLVRYTTVDGEVTEVWLPPVLAVACVLYFPKGFDEEIYSARVVWMND